MNAGYIDDEFYQRASSDPAETFVYARMFGVHAKAVDDAVLACETTTVPEVLYFSMHCEGCVDSVEALLRDNPSRFDADATQYIERFVPHARNFAAHWGWA